MHKTFQKIALGLALLVAPAAFAQNITAASTTCAGTGACVQQAVTDQDGGSTIGISGTFSATLQFEATNSQNPTDPAAVWSSIQLTPTSSSTAATSATAPGLWQGNVAGLTGIRVRCSTYTSGTVAVVIHISPISARSNGSGGAGGAVASVTAADNSLTVTPNTGAVTAALNQSFGGFNFTANGAASASPFIWSGTPFAGTATNSTPLVYMNCTGSTQPSSWSTAGTLFGGNSCTGFAGDFIDFHANGGASAFLVTQAGALAMAGQLNVTGSVVGSAQIRAGTFFSFGSGHVLQSATAPVIGTCGTTPSIVASNGSAAFTVNVGTGGTATTCTVTMPAATTAWGCTAFPNGAPQAAAEVFVVPTSTTVITISNFTASTGAALAFPASAVYNLNCTAY
jgi:hypothetical protein